jgi:hypothetical protein
MAEPTEGRAGLQATIAGLRMCNAAQCEVIENLEEYERTVLGLAGTGSQTEDDPVPAGYRGGYMAELEYLQSRRQALDTLIAAVERYSALAEGLVLEQERTASW